MSFLAKNSVTEMALCAGALLCQSEPEEQTWQQSFSFPNLPLLTEPSSKITHYSLTVDELSDGGL